MAADSDELRAAASLALTLAAITLTVLALSTLVFAAVRVPESDDWPTEFCRSGIGATEANSGSGLAQTLLTDHRAYRGIDCSDVIGERRQFIACGIWILLVTLVTALGSWSRRWLIVLLLLMLPGALFALAGAIVDGPVLPMSALTVAGTLVIIDDIRRIRRRRTPSTTA